MNSEAGKTGKYRMSVRGMMAYVALWAIIFALIHVLREYSSIGATGSYTYRTGLITDFVLPITIGMVFAAIGVACIFMLGKIRHSAMVGFCCFIAGCLVLPMMYIVLLTLAALGVIDLD